MTLRVLQNWSQNQAARDEMRRRMISYRLDHAPRSLIDRLLLRPPSRSPIAVGDLYKSSDVLESLRLLESRLPLDAPILDLGAFASEILCSLHLLGFRRLAGIDLNPRVCKMPFNRNIRYLVGDMNATSLSEGSIGAITAISAIEHGIELRVLFREVARLLAPGGLFLASTGYWPDKIDTSGIRIFDLEWTIFSEVELKALIEEAARHGLAPLGDCRFKATDAPIECAGRRYTFAWFALVKR